MNARIPDARVVAHGTFAALLVLLAVTTFAHAFGVLGDLLGANGTLMGTLLMLLIWALSVRAVGRIFDGAWDGFGQLELALWQGSVIGMSTLALLAARPFLGFVWQWWQADLDGVDRLQGLAALGLFLVAPLAIAALVGAAVAALVALVDLGLRRLAARWLAGFEAP